MQPVPPIAEFSIAIRFQIVQKLQPISLVIFIKRSPWRSFNPEPDAIAIHHAAHARERQTVITKRLPMTRGHHIDRLGTRRYDFVDDVVTFILADRWEPVETLSPNVLSFPRTRGFDCLPVIIDLKQLNSSAQRIPQQHMPLACSFQDSMLDDHQQAIDRWLLRTRQRSIEPKQHG